MTLGPLENPFFRQVASRAYAAPMPGLPVFDCGELFSALDAARADRGLQWFPLAAE